MSSLVPMQLHTQQLLIQQQQHASQNHHMLPAAKVAAVGSSNPLTLELDAAHQIDSDHAMNSKSAGRWTAEEHALFLQGLEKHNKQWKLIAEMVKTRTVVQIRTHAQKYFQKLNKNRAKANKIEEFTASTDEYDTTFSFPSADSRKNSISFPEHSPLNGNSIHSYSTDNTTLGSNVTSSEGESDAERATSSDVQFSTSPADALATKFPATLEANLRQRQNVLRAKSDLVRKRSRDNMKAGSSGSSNSTRSPKKSNTNPNTPAMSPVGKPSSSASAPRVGVQKVANSKNASAAYGSSSLSTQGIAIMRNGGPGSGAFQMEQGNFVNSFPFPVNDFDDDGEQDHGDELDSNFLHMLNKIEWLPEDSNGSLYHSRANSPFTDSASTVSTSTCGNSKHLSANDLLNLAQAHTVFGHPMNTGDANPSNSSRMQQQDKIRDSRVHFSNVISELKLVTEVARNGSNDSDHISLFNLIQQKSVTVPGSSGGQGKLPSMKTLVRTLASSQQQRMVVGNGLSSTSIIDQKHPIDLDHDFSKFILEDCNFLNDGEDFPMGEKSDSDGQVMDTGDDSLPPSVATTSQSLQLPEGSFPDGIGSATMITSPGGGELFVQDTKALVSGETLLQNPKQLSVLHAMPMSVRASDAAAAAIAAAKAESAPRKRGRPRKHPTSDAMNSESASPANYSMNQTQEQLWQNMNSAIQPHALRNSCRKATIETNSVKGIAHADSDRATAFNSSLTNPKSECSVPTAQLNLFGSIVQRVSGPSESDPFDLFNGSLETGMLEDFE